MLYEDVPLRDAREGGCTEIGKILHLKKGIVIRTYLFQSAQQIPPQICRGEKDQPFLDLAQSGGAELLVSGDNDLLALAGQLSDISIEEVQTFP